MADTNIPKTPLFHIGTDLNLFVKTKDACEERGYHRINEEETIMNCYDCNRTFDQETANFMEIKYIVEPRQR